MPKTLCIKVAKKDAQRIHKLLIDKNILNKTFDAAHNGEYVLFAIKPEFREEASNLGDIIHHNLEKRDENTRSLQTLLKNKLTDDELEELGSSFDIIGDIAQIQIPQKLIQKQEIIANAILNSNKNLKTVAKKSSATSGVYRIRKITPIAGENKTKTIAKESGCQFEVDLNKAYYTPRFGSERLRIAAHVQDNENILIPFAGVGPYPIIIEKNANPNKIIAIELNPDALASMKINIEKNKCTKIEPILDDAKKIMQDEKFISWADRIIMPHPSASLSFLLDAIKACKNKGIIHLYGFDKTGDKAKDFYAKAREIANRNNTDIEILNMRTVRPYSKDLEQVVLDLQLIK